MTLPFFLARRFVAGETLNSAFPVLKDLKRQGLHTTLDLLGEYIDDRNLAARARDEYVRIVHALANVKGDPTPDRNISIKLSMIGQTIDQSFCVENLKTLLAAAKNNDVFVRLDMEGSDVTQSTIDIFEQVFPQYPDHLGIVLQAYLHRTRADVERMCALKARVRLCKGAYREPASKAHQKMADIRTHFVEYMTMLISDARYPGIATHDDILINATKAYVEEAKIPAEAFEFQMLYGIRPETQVGIAQDGYNMRVYVPFGSRWFPYFSRRIRERRENAWFVLRNLFKK